MKLKTPLASLTARVTNLLERDTSWDPEMIRNELGAVSEDLGRLNNSISDLLDLSRLQSGNWTPRIDWYELGEVVGSVMPRLAARERERVQFPPP